MLRRISFRPIDHDADVAQVCGIDETSMQFFASSTKCAAPICGSSPPHVSQRSAEVQAATAQS